MKRFLFGATILIGIALPSPAYPQLVSEFVQGRIRICAYDGPKGYTTGSDRRPVLSVGLGENCPSTFPHGLLTRPGRSSGAFGRPAPPSAMLRSEWIDGPYRVCTYEQLGTTWEFNISPQTYCPLAAGMLPQPGSPSAAR